MVKLSCVGSIGLSFMGTLRATQIRHDWKSKRGKGVGVVGGAVEGTCGGKKRSGVGSNKEDGADRERGRGWERIDDRREEEW